MDYKARGHTIGNIHQSHTLLYTHVSQEDAVIYAMEVLKANRDLWDYITIEDETGECVATVDHEGYEYI